MYLEEELQKNVQYSISISIIHNYYFVYKKSRKGKSNYFWTLVESKEDIFFDDFLYIHIYVGVTSVRDFETSSEK